MVQQAGVVDGGGGGQADGPGLPGGGGDLAGISGRAVQQVEEAVPKVRPAVLSSHGPPLLGEEPLDERLCPGGVDVHAGYGAAIGVGEGRVGVHRQQGVDVYHLVVRLLEDHGVHGGGGVLDDGMDDRLMAAAAAGRQQQRQKAGKKFFHVLFLHVPKIKTAPAGISPGRSMLGKRLVHRFQKHLFMFCGVPSLSYHRGGGFARVVYPGSRATAFEISRKGYQEGAEDSKRRQSAFSGY